MFEMLLSLLFWLFGVRSVKADPSVDAQIMREIGYKPSIDPANIPQMIADTLKNRRLAYAAVEEDRNLWRQRAIACSDEAMDKDNA